jgi:DNA modification methylase
MNQSPAELQITYRPTAELQPYARNARTHDKKQIDDLARNIQTFGFVVPILIDEDDQVIAGHGRLAAAKQIGMDQVPTIELNHLTDEQQRAYVLADNKLTERGGWDRELLGGELNELRDAGIDLALTGFEQGELDELLEAFDPDPPEPAATPSKKQPISRRGDFWLLGDHVVMCGDSTNADDVARLMKDGKADLVITDPPYGVSYEGRTADKLTIQADDQDGDDLLKLLVPAMKLAAKHAKDEAGFYVWHSPMTRRDFEHAIDAAGLVERMNIVWIKSQITMGWSDYQNQIEPCFYCGKAGHRPRWYGDRSQSNLWRITGVDADGTRSIEIASGVRVSDGQGREIFVQAKAPKSRRKSTRLIRLAEGEDLQLVGPADTTDAWQVDRPMANRDHPTSKPTELATIAIHNSSQEGDTVLDLFGGAGFVLLGAHRTGRKARLMELDPVYVDVIVRRWIEATDGDAVRLSDGVSFSELEAE